MAASQATQKRWLTAPNGKLSKAELGIVLRKEAAWKTLPLATRQRLYDLLPRASEEQPHDPDVHPLKSRYSTRIMSEVKAWQDDLKEGKETKKWREEAMQAGQDRSLGLWDDWKEANREQTWGPRQAENEESKENEPEIDDSEGEKDVVMT